MKLAQTLMQLCLDEQEQYINIKLTDKNARHVLLMKTGREIKDVFKVKIT